MTLLFLLTIAIPAASAQDQTYLAWVTTQDFSSLRRGPGTGFERITVLDPAVTLPAIGRSVDSRWIQVEYEGQPGWISSNLLVWSGDVIALPVDGMNPMPFVRQEGKVGTTTRETPIYAHEVTPEDQVGTIPAGENIEITGRLGTQGYHWWQIRYQGQLYWVGSWNIRTEYSSSTVLDIAYLFSAGRLTRRMREGLSTASNRFRNIESRWLNLAEGENVSCANIPTATSLSEVAPADVQEQPLFAPAVESLNVAIQHTNAAIEIFEDACNAPQGTFVSQDEVRNALSELDDARRAFTFAASLLNGLEGRDLFFGNNN